MILKAGGDVNEVVRRGGVDPSGSDVGGVVLTPPRLSCLRGGHPNLRRRNKSLVRGPFCDVLGLTCDSLHNHKQNK